MRLILYAAILAKFGFHMFELFMLDNEVQNLDQMVQNVVVQDFIGPMLPNSLTNSQKTDSKTNILNFDSD